MDVLTQKNARSINPKPTGLYLIELRSRFLGLYARRQKLTPPVDTDPAETAPAPTHLQRHLKRVKS